MRHIVHRTGLVLVMALTAACGGSGDEGFADCDPSPQIGSSPPTVATAGYTYTYAVRSSYVCVLFLCSGVEAVRVPAGATVDRDLVTWTPPAAYIGEEARFKIRTRRDTCGGTREQSWRVRVYAPPVIDSIGTSETIVASGSSVTITPVFSGSGTLSGFGPVTSGVPLTSPPLAETTDFVLTVTNAIGAQTESAIRIEVPEPPAITTFRVNPAIVEAQQPSRLSWQASGDWSEARIDPGNIDVFGQTGFDIVSPDVTTTYTLTLTNALGATASAEVTLEVVDPPQILAFDASTTRAALGDSVALSAHFEGTSAVLGIDNGQGGFSALRNMTSGETWFSESLYRTTRFRLTVTGRTGRSVTSDLTIVLEGPGTFAVLAGFPVVEDRRDHRAVLLDDGRVLLVNGRFDGNSTEIFDPIGDTFTAGPNLLHGYREQATARMADGRVLIVGWRYDNDAGEPVTLEIFDPGSNLIAPAAGGTPLNDATTFYPRATLLDDGRVLIVSSRFAWTYDPATDSVTPLPRPPEQASLLEKLRDSRILLVNGNGYRDSLIFDPVTDTYAIIDGLDNRIRGSGFASILMGDGRVLVAGGGSTRRQIYVPVSGTFEPFPNTAVYFFSSASGMAAFADGSVLLTGGDDYPDTGTGSEIFDPYIDTSRRTGGLFHARKGHSATTLQDGRVLVVGGCLVVSPCPAEIYTP